MKKIVFLVLVFAFVFPAIALAQSCVTVSVERGQRYGVQVDCPRGYVVTGGGFNDGGGFSDLGEEDDQDWSLPMDNGWYCKEDHSEGDSECYAVCCDASLIDTFIVEEVGSQNEGVTALCPNGTIMTGGGFGGEESNNDDQDASQPTRNGWFCHEDKSVPNAKCSAVCAEPLEGELDCITVYERGRQDGGVQVDCPEGYFVTGGGFGGEYVNNDDQDKAFPNGNGWYCREDNSVDNAKCYARCCGFGPTEMTCVEAKEAGLLRGYIDGDMGVVVNETGFEYDVGLAVYKKFDEVIDNQEIYDWDTGTVYADDEIALYVDLPDCKYQIDLFCGEVLESLDGQRYGERLIDAEHGGDEYCVHPECEDDWDCRHLDDDYCEGDRVMYDDGVCVRELCEVETREIEDCDDYDDTYCEGTEVWGDDGYCVEEFCSGAWCEVESGMVLECDDGLYCNGEEDCELGNCVPGRAIDCSPFDLDGVATCFYSPDDNPMTWDFFAGFESECDEEEDACTGGVEEIESDCDMGECRAECESDEDCDDQDEHTIDTCLEDCTCDYESIPHCGDGVLDDGEECDDGNNEDGDGCSADCTIEPEPLMIIAHKIVCEDEADLPNWGTGGPNINSSTAEDFVDGHQDCYFEDDWEFQWAYAGTGNPGDHVGEAGGGWTTFGPTDWSGEASVVIEDLDETSRLWIREVFKQGYIEFTYNANGKSNRDDYSAEMYCHNDVLNYDNYDYIINPEQGITYYCVAFNVVEGGCREDDDCDDLDRDYCEENAVMHDEGVCVDYVCEVETSETEDCGEKNGIMNECGLMEWHCSEELNRVDCVLTNVLPQDEVCDDYCSGTERNDGYCDDITYRCEWETEECDDDLYCNGEEDCDTETVTCVDGTAVDCTPFDLDGVATCFYSPDDNPLTWDFFAGFESYCDEGLDACVEGEEELTHDCDIEECDAECESEEDCACEEDACVENDYYDYPEYGDCVGCECDTETGQGQACEPEISPDDPRCTECQTDLDCDDGDYCNGEEVCNTETYTCETGEDVDCSHLDDQCNEGVCDEGQDSCVQEPVEDGTPCDDGLWCNLGEVCIDGECSNGEARDCTPFDLPPVETCFYSPDDNPLTWDFFAGFESVCDEELDLCTEGEEELEHDCDMQRCDADCEDNEDCGETDCDYLDGCYGDDYHEYDDVENDCVGCECEENECGEPADISYEDPRCTPPELNKIVGEPKDEWDGSDSIFYPWIADYCWNGQEDEIECWKVTMETPITLECILHPEAPAEDVFACFNVELDGDDATEEYCEEYLGEMGQDGFCCVEGTVEEFYFTEETEHNLEFYCVDELENKTEIDEEKFKVEGEPFIIQLNKKWNLISIPFVLYDPDIDTVFEDVMENLESIWAFEDGEWLIFRADNPLASSLHEVHPGYGYWIAMYDDDELAIAGSMFNPGVTPPERELDEGWNLIGYYGTEGLSEYDGPHGEGREAGCVLYSLGESVYDKGWTSLLTYWEPYNPDQWVGLSYYDRMDPGAGYWISLPEPGVYGITTIC